MHFLPINFSWKYTTLNLYSLSFILKNSIFLRTKKKLEWISSSFFNKIICILTFFKNNNAILQKRHIFSYIFLDIIYTKIFLYFSCIHFFLVLLYFFGKIFYFLQKILILFIIVREDNLLY